MSVPPDDRARPLDSGLGLSFEHIIVERRAAVAYIRFNRPDVLNATNAAMLHELLTACRVVKSDEAIRVLVLGSTDSRAFSVGGDINDWGTRSVLDGWRYAQLHTDLSETIWDLRKPSIAAVDGYCLGGGLELASSCTFILAAKQATFGQPEILSGTFPHGGGTQRLTRLIGRVPALKLMLLGDRIDASEAQRIGLVAQVVNRDELEQAVDELADRLAERAPIAVEMILLATNAAWDNTLEQGMELERALGALTYASTDMEEGRRAFLEKRPPRFLGR